MEEKQLLRVHGNLVRLEVELTLSLDRGTLRSLSVVSP